MPVDDGQEIDDNLVVLEATALSIVNAFVWLLHLTTLRAAAGALYTYRLTPSTLCEATNVVKLLPVPAIHELQPPPAGFPRT